MIKKKKMKKKKINIVQDCAERLSMPLPTKIVSQRKSVAAFTYDRWTFGGVLKDKNNRMDKKKIAFYQNEKFIS